MAAIEAVVKRGRKRLAWLLSSPLALPPQLLGMLGTEVLVWQCPVLLNVLLPLGRAGLEQRAPTDDSLMSQGPKVPRGCFGKSRESYFI